LIPSTPALGRVWVRISDAACPTAPHPGLDRAAHTRSPYPAKAKAAKYPATASSPVSSHPLDPLAPSLQKGTTRHDYSPRPRSTPCHTPRPRRPASG
jgi:hypothetical protein